MPADSYYCDLSYTGICLAGTSAQCLFHMGPGDELFCFLTAVGFASAIVAFHSAGREELQIYSHSSWLMGLGHPRSHVHVLLHPCGQCAGHSEPSLDLIYRRSLECRKACKISTFSIALVITAVAGSETNLHYTYERLDQRVRTVHPYCLSDYFRCQLLLSTC